MSVRELAARLATLVSQGHGDAPVAIPEGDGDAAFGVWYSPADGVVRLDVTAPDTLDCILR